MKKLLSVIITLLLTINAFSCDFSTIQQQGDNFVYNKDCHLEVGHLVKENSSQKQQLDELKKANDSRTEESAHLRKSIQLKDLALDKADERVSKWREESYNQNDRLLRQDRLSGYTNWFYFGGGVAIAILSVFAAGQLRR
jgi:hypothetical protein